MKLLLAVVNILFLFGSVIWPQAYYFSIFLFDSPGSSQNSAAYLFALAIWTYPLPAVLGNILFWVRIKKGGFEEHLLFTAVSSLGYVFIVGAYFAYAILSP